MEISLPASGMASTLQSAYVPSDLVAGVTLAAYALPVSLAYATLAGLPPQVGIYGYLWRDRLCPVRIVAPTGGWTDFRDLTDDRQYCWSDGGRGCATSTFRSPAWRLSPLQDWR